MRRGSRLCIPVRSIPIDILFGPTSVWMECMRLAALADVHGNRQALAAVARDLERRQVDVILGLGDYVMTSAGAEPASSSCTNASRTPTSCAGTGDDWDHYRRFRPLARVDPYPLYAVVSRLPERFLLELQGTRLPAAARGSGRPLPAELLARGAPPHRDPGPTPKPSWTCAVSTWRWSATCTPEPIDVQPEGVLVTAGTVGLWWPATYVLIELEARSVHISVEQVEYDRAAAVREWRAAYLADPGPDGPHGARKLERAAAERALAYDWPFDIPYWVTIGERVTWRKP